MKKYCSRCGLELPEDARAPFNCPMCGGTTVRTTPPPKMGHKRTLIVLEMFHGIGTLGLLAFLTLLTFSPYGRVDPWFWVYQVSLLVLGILSFVIAYGLRAGKSWAWSLAYVLAVLAIFINLAWIIGYLNFFILHYLTKTDVKRSFGVTDLKPRKLQIGVLLFSVAFLVAVLGGAYVIKRVESERMTGYWGQLENLGYEVKYRWSKFKPRIVHKDFNDFLSDLRSSGAMTVYADTTRGCFWFELWIEHEGGGRTGRRIAFYY